MQINKRGQADQIMCAAFEKIIFPKLIDVYMLRNKS